MVVSGGVGSRSRDGREMVHSVEVVLVVQLELNLDFSVNGF